MALKLNDKQIKSLLRQAKPGRYAAGSGLYFRVSNEGTGFWVLRYTVNKKRKELTLGRYGTYEGELTLAKATLEAAQLQAQVRSGIDPKIEKKRSNRLGIRTVDELAEDWLAKDIEKRLKHPGIPRRVYQKDLSPVIGELSLDRISPIDISLAIEKIVQSNRPSIANDALMFSKQIFEHGVRLGLINHNPAAAFTIHQAGGVEKSRKRALNLKEVGIVFRVFRENTQHFTPSNYLAVALLLMLGVRKTELTAAKWSEFDLVSGVWMLLEDRSKTDKAITIPLPSVAIGWLHELKCMAFGSEYVFPARRASKRRGYISDDTLNHALTKLFAIKVSQEKLPESQMEKAGIEHFTIHDLRRTCRTLLGSIGVPPHIAERCLNHKIKGVEGIYDQHDYFEERKEALQNLSDILEPLINEGRGLIAH